MKGRLDLEIKMIVRTAAGVEPGTARRAYVVAIEILTDAQLSAARAAENSFRVEV